ALRGQPVAGIVLGIGAQPLLGRGCVHGEAKRLIGLWGPAMNADRVVEIDGLAAIAALEDTHAGMPRAWEPGNGRRQEKLPPQCRDSRCPVLPQSSRPLTIIDKV